MAKTTYFLPGKRIEKLPKKLLLDLNFDLINAFRFVNKPYETALLLQDLLTANEIKNLGKRLRIAKLLLDNKTQRDISKELHCSLATVTKVSVWLAEGGEGFRKIIARLPKRYEFPEKFPRGPIEYHLPQTLYALTKYTLAQRQEDRLEKFLKGVEDKSGSDKALQEEFDQEFIDSKNKKR
ncbi:helix-turn-helix domain-containing protein [Candidatus Microgenomates bacterium]|nr:helix-turn-helix domain-containing protein [Candidatus Microgenomates bacterium]